MCSSWFGLSLVLLAIATTKWSYEPNCSNGNLSGKGNAGTSTAIYEADIIRVSSEFHHFSLNITLSFLAFRWFVFVLISLDLFAFEEKWFKSDVIHREYQAQIIQLAFDCVRCNISSRTVKGQSKGYATAQNCYLNLFTEMLNRSPKIWAIRSLLFVFFFHFVLIILCLQGN